MKTFKDYIAKAIQRTPSMKLKIKNMQKDLEKAFGDILYSKKFDYDIAVDDLKILFNLINHWLFKDKLNIENITFSISTNLPAHNEKGFFRLDVDENAKHILGVVKYQKDNFFHVVNVLIHEMIHYYDFTYGPLKEKSNIAYVDKISRRQYVDRYDAHGAFF